MVYLIIRCDTKVRQVRENINERIAITNIKFLGYYTMKVNRNIIINLVNQVVRIIDTQKSKIEYTLIKYKSKIDFIDLEVRNVFSNK